MFINSGFMKCALASGFFIGALVSGEEAPGNTPIATALPKELTDYLVWVDQAVTTIDADVAIEVFEGKKLDRTIAIRQYMDAKRFRWDQSVTLADESKPRSKDSVVFDGATTYSFNCLNGVLNIHSGRNPFGALAPCPLFVGLNYLLAPRIGSDGAEAEAEGWGLTLLDVKAAHGHLTPSASLVISPDMSLEVLRPLSADAADYFLHRLITPMAGRPTAPAQVREILENRKLANRREISVTSFPATMSVQVADRTLTLAKVYERVRGTAPNDTHEVYTIRKLAINQPLDDDCFTPDASMATQIYDNDKKRFTVDHR